MAVIMRTARDQMDALQVAAAFDKHGIRVVSIVAPPARFAEGTVEVRPAWIVYGQGEDFDCDAVDETYGRILDGKDPW